LDQTERTGRVGSADIAGLLRREIAQGRLAPKDKLPAERALAETYGVARGTIRDALTQLANDGLVQVRAGSGTYVTDQIVSAGKPSGARAISCTPTEVLEARLALEPHICSLAAACATDALLDMANEQINVMAASHNDPDKFLAADRAFRTILTESTGNRLLIQIMNAVNEVSEDKQHVLQRRSLLDHAAIVQHSAWCKRLLDTIRARESDRAATFMKLHLERIRSLAL